MFRFKSLKLILSFFFGKPPTIQKILCEFCNANFVEIKEVAFESFIKIQFLFLRNISYLCGNPTKEFKDLFKVFFNQVLGDNLKTAM